MAWTPIPDFGQGLNRDSTPEEMALGVSSNAQNMRYRNGYAERFRGIGAAYTAPPVTPYAITHYTVGTSRFVVYPGLQKTYADDGTTQTEITLASNAGGIDDRFCAFAFNGVYIQNNGKDVPQYWGGNPAVKLADLPAWPAGYTAGFMRAFGNHLVAGDITKAGVRYRSLILASSLADPGTVPTSWDAADPTVEALEEPLAGTNGTLIDSLPLGDMNVIYKDDALHFQQDVQSAFVYRFGRLPGDTGLLARGCVVNTPMGHVYLSPGFDVLLHSGQGPQSILTGRMRKWLSSNMNAAQAQRSFLVANPATNEVLVCFPQGSTTICSQALVWNWKDNTFGVRDLPSVTYASLGQVTLPTSSDTWAGDTETWADDGTTWGESDYAPNSPRVVFARATSLALYDATSKDVGNDFEARFERVGMHFEAPDTVKLIRGVRPRIEAAAGAVIKVQVGAAMLPGAYPTWQAAVDYTVGSSTQVDAFASGRYLALRMYSTSGIGWRVRSAEMDIVAQGGW
jgi:hypothetical protein